MPGAFEVSLAYSPQSNHLEPTQSTLKRRKAWASPQSVTSDLLSVWDASTVFLAGAGAALLLTFPGLGQAGLQLYEDTILDALLRMSSVGAVLTPLLLRDREQLDVAPAALRRLLRRLLMLIAIVLAVALATGLIAQVPRAWLAMWGVGSLAVAVAGRLLLAKLLRTLAAEQLIRDRVAIVGSGDDADWLRAAFGQAGPLGLELVGPRRSVGNLDAAIADLLERGRRGELDRVVLALPGLASAEVRRLTHQLKALQIEVASLHPLLGAGGRLRTTKIGDVPLFLVASRPQQGYGGLTKEIMDRGLALGALLWTLPVLLLIALAIKLDSPGPVLFRQRRHGVNGTEFEVFKFRTMVWAGATAGSGAVQTGRRDRRITRLGAILRKTSIDEVPQLLNVLNGTMSLVGPRPHPTVMRTENRLGDEITPDYPHRHRVKPGITGWAQVNGLRGATETAEQLRRRIEHDNFYIENWSPWFDLQILLLTPISLLFRRDNAF